MSKTHRRIALWLFLPVAFTVLVQLGEPRAIWLWCDVLRVCGP